MSHDSHVNIIFNYHKAISTDEISTVFLPANLAICNVCEIFCLAMEIQT